MKWGIIVLSFLLIASVAIGHLGRTDSSGGHWVRKGPNAGTYHYHNSGYSVRNYSVPKSSVAKTTSKTSSINNSWGKSFSRSNYKKIQKALKTAGCYSGPIDGLFGPKSKGALQDCKRLMNKTHFSDEKFLETILKAESADTKRAAEVAIFAENTVNAPSKAFIEEKTFEKQENTEVRLKGKLISGTTYVQLSEISNAVDVTFFNATSSNIPKKTISGVSYVPLRDVCNSVNAQLTWNAKEKTAYVSLRSGKRLKVIN